MGTIPPQVRITPRRTGGRARAGGLTAAIIGTAVMLALFFAARRTEWAAFEAEFARNANREASLVERNLERLGFAAHAFQQIIAAHDGVDAQTFATFAHPFLTEHASLAAIEWVPYVPDASRDAMEADSRRQGSPKFRILERDPSGAFVPAQRRNDYFPILYVASLVPETRPVVGLDHGSVAERRRIYQQAVDDGAFLVSPPIELLLLKERGVFAVAPVFRNGMPTETREQRRAALLGFVVSLYNVRTLLSEVVDRNEFRQLELSVLEHSRQGDVQTVYRSTTKNDMDLGWPRWMLPDALEHSVQFEFGAIGWNVRIAVTRQYLSHHLPLFHWLILPVGQLIIVLMSGFIWTLSRGRDHQEAMVEERTQELAASGETMARILGAMDMAADGVLIIAPDNRVSYANRTLLETIGADGLDRVVGRNSDQVLCDDTGMLNSEDLRGLRDIVRRTGTWKGELTLPNTDPARRKYLLGHVRRLPDGGRVAVLNDVTEARRREEEQRRLERQLEEARKLEVLGTLAAGIAHDFNNLLGAILGFAQFIVDDSDDGTPLHRYATRIVKAGQQAKCLIGQILTFSHRRELPREQVDLGQLVADNLSIIRALVAPTTALAVDADPHGPMVSAQPSELVQVLVNLVINANEALEGEEGTVAITVTDADPHSSALEPLFFPHGKNGNHEAITNWTDSDGWRYAGFGALLPGTRYRVLSVSDTGCGMDGETATRIFSPFFTTKGKKGGTGLGLAVVQNIVIHHHGGVLVRTAPGRGSTFSVALPEAETGAAPQTESPPPPEQSALSHQGTILLVENSAHFGDMLMTALFRLGYEIATCSDSAEALAFIEEDPAAWDLIITDQIMPGMTGTELVAAIKANHPDLPCIICTAYPGDLTEIAARDAGADGFVAKPLDLGRFSLMVKDLIGRKEGAT